MNARTMPSPLMMVGLLTQQDNASLLPSYYEDKWNRMVGFIENRYNVNWQKVVSYNRYVGITYIRQLAGYWFYEKYGNTKFVTLRWIGEQLNNRDHTTILHSNKSIADQLETNHPVPVSNMKIPKWYRVEFPHGITTVKEDYEQFKRQIILWL